MRTPAGRRPRPRRANRSGIPDENSSTPPEFRGLTAELVAIVAPEMGPVKCSPAGDDATAVAAARRHAPGRVPFVARTTDRLSPRKVRKSLRRMLDLFMASTGETSR